jgi:Leucine-rich repeat (LRR) protein
VPLEPTHAESVADALTRPDQVTTLHLHDDDATTVSLDPRIVELRSLRSVHIGSNRADVQEIDGLSALAQVASLRSLSLSVEGPVPLPAAISTLRQLTELHLRGRWTALPAELAQLTGLARLDLHLSWLRELPAELGALHKLTFLSVRGCRLKHLPESLGDLESLVDLFAEDNRLVTLPESIGRLGALRRLLLAGNRLEEVPASLASLPALEVLSLRDNPSLEVIPAEVRGHPRRGRDA